MIFERNFFETPETSAVRGKKPPASAAVISGSSSKSPWGDLEKQLGDRTKVLLTKYKILRASDYSVAVKLKLNKEEEMEVIEEEKEEAPPVDVKGKKK